MLYLLLFLFIVFVVIPLCSAMFKMWQLRRRVRNFMNDPFGAGKHATGYGQGSYHTSQQGHKRRPRKKIDPDIGEYVAFTEVEGASGQSESYRTATSVRVEQQVVDVEWEDIPEKR